MFFWVGPNPQVFSQDLTWLFFSQCYSQIHFKFDVRMNYHQSYSFSKIFQIIFIVVSTFIFFIIPEYLNNSWWCFSSSFLDLKTEEEFSSKSYLFSQRFVMLAWCHPLIIVFNCENSFHPSGAIRESFQFDSPKAIISEDLFVLNIQLSFSKSYRCIIQVLSNQLGISAFTCI